MRSLLLFFLIHLLPSILSITSILLHRLHTLVWSSWYFSLTWFSSYLTLTFSSSLHPKCPTSSFSNLSCGVPQGSVLGPLLFNSFIQTPPGTVISKNSIKYHLWNADDTQLYISFTPSNSTSSSWNPLQILSLTFSPGWTLTGLLLNPSKTEFLLIGTKFNNGSK